MVQPTKHENIFTIKWKFTKFTNTNHIGRLQTKLGHNKNKAETKEQTLTIEKKFLWKRLIAEH